MLVILYVPLLVARIIDRQSVFQLAQLSNSCSEADEASCIADERWNNVSYGHSTSTESFDCANERIVIRSGLHDQLQKKIATRNSVTYASKRHVEKWLKRKLHEYQE